MQKQTKNYKRYSENDFNYPLDTYESKNSNSYNDDNIVVSKKILKKPSKIKIYVPIEVEKNRFCKILEKVKIRTDHDHLLKITHSKHEIEMDESEGNDLNYKSINKRCKSSFDIKNCGYEKNKTSSDSIEMKEEQLKKRRKEFDDDIYENNINNDNGSIKFFKKHNNKSSTRRNIPETSSNNNFINNVNDDSNTGSEKINKIYKNDLKYNIDEFLKPEIIKEIITPLKEFLESSISEYRNKNSSSSNTLNNDKNLKINSKLKATSKTSKISPSPTKRSLNDKKELTEIENIKNDLKNFQLKILHKFEQQSNEKANNNNNNNNNNIMKNTNNNINKINSATLDIRHEKLLPQLQNQQSQLPQLPQQIQSQQNQFKQQEQIDYNNDYCRKYQSFNNDFLKNQYQCQKNWDLQNQQFQQQLPQQYQQIPTCQQQQQQQHQHQQQERQEQMHQELLLKQGCNGTSGSLNPNFPVNYNQFGVGGSGIDLVGNGNAMIGGGRNGNSSNTYRNSLTTFFQQNQQQHQPLINGNTSNNLMYDRGRDLREFQSQLQLAGLPDHGFNKQQIGDGQFPKGILKNGQQSPILTRKTERVQMEISKKLSKQPQKILNQTLTTTTKEQPYCGGYTTGYAKQLFMYGSDDSTCSSNIATTTKDENLENFVNFLNMTSENSKTKIKQHPYTSFQDDDENFQNPSRLPTHSLADCSNNYDLPMKYSYQNQQQKNNEINNNKYFDAGEEQSPKNKSFSYYNLYDPNIDDENNQDNDGFNLTGKDDYTTHGMIQQQNPIVTTSGTKNKNLKRNQLPFATHFKVSDNIVKIIRKLRKNETAMKAMSSCSTTNPQNDSIHNEKSYLPNKTKHLKKQQLGIQLEEHFLQQQLKQKKIEEKQKHQSQPQPQQHINKSKLVYPVETYVYYPDQTNAGSFV